MSLYYVYCYLNLINGKRYFGKGTGERINFHTCSTSNSLIARAIRKHGLQSFKVFKLYEGLTEDEAMKMERDCIARYKTNVSNGGHGYNCTDGGEGISGYRHTEEMKEHIRKSVKETYATGDARTRCGAATPEVKARCSEATKRKWQDPEFRRRQVEGAKRRIRPPELGAKISAKLKGRKLSEEHKQKISEGRRKEKGGG